MARARRGVGEGGLYQVERTRTTASGETVTSSYWTATVEAGRDAQTGARRRRVVRAKTKQAALAKVAKARQELEQGIRNDPTVTVEQFLQDWTRIVLPARVGPATVANYKAAVDGHLIPGLGHHRLRELTPEHVDRFLRAKADAGLSKRYVGRMRSILTDALNHAEARQLVARNAGRLSIMPACTPSPKPRALTLAEASALVQEALRVDPDGRPVHRLGVMFVLMVTLGLRPGEATGLRWADLDHSAETLSVTGSIKRVPRSDGSGYDLERGLVKKSTARERTLALPAGLVRLLGEHQRQQRADQRAAGPIWVDQDLIFASEAGTPLDPSNVRRAIAKAAVAAGIAGPVSPYTARHSAASLALDAGIPLDQVADLLGDDPRTVLLHYRHRVRPVITTAVASPLAATLNPRG